MQTCMFLFFFFFFNIFDLIIVNQNIQWNNKLLSVMQVVFSHFVCLHLVNHLAPILANLHSSACVFECYAHILQSNQQPMHKNKFRHSLFSCSIICCWICVTKWKKGSVTTSVSLYLELEFLELFMQCCFLNLLQITLGKLLNLCPTLTLFLSAWDWFIAISVVSGSCLCSCLFMWSQSPRLFLLGKCWKLHLDWAVLPKAHLVTIAR